MALSNKARWILRSLGAKAVASNIADAIDQNTNNLADVSHVIVASGSLVVTQTNQQNTVSGMAATDSVFIQSANAHPNLVATAAINGAADVLTINCQADPGAVDALVKYQIVRAK